MGDGIIMILTAGVIFFMFRRGGCCGHSHGGHGPSEEESKNRES